jgi:hypothetical protein
VLRQDYLLIRVTVSQWGPQLVQMQMSR